MNRAILYHESLNFVRRGPAVAIFATLIVALTYAGFSGDRWRDAQWQSLDRFQTERLAEMREWRSQLADVEAGNVEATPYDANPMSINFPAVLPPASLADFAIGHADLHPSSADVSPWRNLSSVFGRYQFDNPTTLAASSFDVATVIVVLLPLLMIVVSFDVIASERARGSLAMVLAAPVRLSVLVWNRLLVRNGLLLIAAAGSMFVLAIANDAGGDRFARLALWFSASFLYALFWLAAIAFCIARFLTATTTAAALIGIWLLSTVAVPATIATLAEVLYPTPSRLAFLSDIRTAQGETNVQLDQLTDGFLLDHPDLSVGDENVPTYYRAAFLANQAARDSTRPIVAAYEDARAGRDQTVVWTQYLSPSVVAQRLLLLSAGADLGRQHRFQSQVLSALDELAAAVGPAVVSRNRLPLAEFDRLEQFSFDDISARQIARDAIWSVLFLLVVSGALGVAAHRRLQARELLGER